MSALQRRSECHWSARHSFNIVLIASALNGTIYSQSGALRLYHPLYLFRVGGGGWNSKLTGRYFHPFPFLLFSKLPETGLPFIRWWFTTRKILSVSNCDYLLSSWLSTSWWLGAVQSRLMMVSTPTAFCTILTFLFPSPTHPYRSSLPSPVRVIILISDFLD